MVEWLEYEIRKRVRAAPIVNQERDVNGDVIALEVVLPDGSKEWFRCTESGMTARGELGGYGMVLVVDDEPRAVNGWRDKAIRLEAQLPEGMKHCTIQAKQCELGHSWLTAANWVQHGCPTCANFALERECAEYISRQAEKLAAKDARIAELAAELAKRPAAFVAPESEPAKHNPFRELRSDPRRMGG